MPAEDLWCSKPSAVDIVDGGGGRRLASETAGGPAILIGRPLAGRRDKVQQFIRLLKDGHCRRAL